MNTFGKYCGLLVLFILNACSNSNALKQNDSITSDSIIIAPQSTDTVISINDTTLNERVNHDNAKRSITNSIEKFDYSTFKKLSANKKSSYLSEDSTMIELGEEKSYFYKTSIKNKSNYVSYKTYYKNTRGLKSDGNSFSKFPVGVHKLYNLKGQLTDTIDYDGPFKFKLQDLILKMQVEFKVDIRNKKRYVSIYRSNKNQPIYLIHMRNEIENEYNEDGIPQLSDPREILINGLTGVIIENKNLRLTK